MTGVALSGTAVGVRSAHLADAIIVPATDEEGTVGLYLVPTAGAGVRLDTFERTDRGLASDVHLEGAAAELLAEGPEEDRVDWLLRQVWIAVAALQSGISQAAVRQAADYTSGREQFGVPIATFQAVAHQIANCHIDTEAMEVTYLNALWRETTERPSRAAVHVAKYWAGEAGDRVARTVQHVHGGMGADVTYPIHRYMLWTPSWPTPPAPGPGSCSSSRTSSRGGAAVSGTQITDRAGEPRRHAAGARDPADPDPHRRRRPRDPRLPGRAPRPGPRPSAGTPDIFMNILNTNGLVGRYVTDWAGPRGAHEAPEHPPRGAELPRRHDADDRRGRRRRARTPSRRGARHQQLGATPSPR